jgi:hypothetical protein
MGNNLFIWHIGKNVYNGDALAEASQRINQTKERQQG